LKTLAKVEQSDIDKILELFDKLDKDNSGSLTRDDIQFIPNQTAKFHYKSTRNLTSKRPY
jgi:Ca2+-binding EF-hand superfamily protein